MGWSASVGWRLSSSHSLPWPQARPICGCPCSEPKLSGLPYESQRRKRLAVYGTIGAIIGTFIAPLLGTLIGYAGGILLGEYQVRGDWQEALKASLGGLAGWGLATAVQLGGGILILIIFAISALTA